MHNKNNISVDDALSQLLLALDYEPAKLSLGPLPKGNIKSMTYQEKKDRFRPLIERKFQNKYPFT